MNARKCPECQAQTKEKDYNGIIINVCQNCQGIFLDFGEIKQVIDSVEINTLFEKIQKWDFKKDNKWKDIVCPDCDETMEEREYIYGSGNHINFCKSCGGIYLDAWEIDDIQKYNASRLRSEEAKKLLAQAEMEGIMASKKQGSTLNSIENSSVSGVTWYFYKLFKRFF